MYNGIVAFYKSFSFKIINKTFWILVWVRPKTMPCLALMINVLCVGVVSEIINLNKPFWYAEYKQFALFVLNAIVTYLLS